MEALVAALLMGISTNKDHFISTAGGDSNIYLIPSSRFQYLFIRCENETIIECAHYYLYTCTHSDGAANATIPPLIANPYAWNNIANMIFCEPHVLLHT